MTTPNQLTRRILLQRAMLASAAAAGSGSLLAGCASGGDDDAGSADGGGEKTAENPFGVKADAPLDVVIFKGGYGDDYAKFHQSLYKKKFPDAQISHKGITDITQQLQPRFNAGSPPDMIDNSGAQLLPMSTLASSGQLADLAPLFDADSVDKAGTKVRDTLEPIALEAADLLGDGKLLVLDYVLTVFGLWYDKKLFDSKGWKPAQTWTDFLALCEDIKKAGIAPLAYQGKHGNYIGWIVTDMAVKHGGHEVIKAIDSLEPNAWKHPSIKLAAEALQELRGKGYIMQGTDGLDHIQSQTRWNEGKAAFIPSGSWLENEQKPVVEKVNPQFQTYLTATPLLDGAKLPFECGQTQAGENFIVPEKAKNKAGGLELLRLMLSKEGAAKFTELTGSPTVVKGAADGLKLSPGAESANKLLAAGGTNNWTGYYAAWYAPMDKPSRGVFAELAAGRISPDEFQKRMQDLADKTAKDPKIQKRTRK